MKKKILCLFLISVLALYPVSSAFAQGKPAEGFGSGTDASGREALLPENAPEASAQPDSSQTSLDLPPEPGDDSAAEPEQSEPSVPVMPPVQLSIDSVHTYEDMDQTFENGYSPKIVDHHAIFTLPLKSSEPLADNCITVSLEFAPGADKAFVAASYEKSVPLMQAVPKNEAAAQEVFLASFSLQMLTERVNGVYPVTAHIRAADRSGAPITMDYTVFVTVSDGRPSEPPKEPEPEPKKPTAEPVVYIENSVVSPGDVQAGEPFTITLTLKNSVKTKSVRDLLVTVDTGELKVDLLEGSNVFPIETIKAGGKAELILHLKAQPSIPAGKHKINVAFQYNSSETLNLSSQGVCMLNVRQKSELSYAGAKIPQEVIAGSTVTLQTELMNTGKSTLYNCKVETAIDGLDAGGCAFVGEIKPGDSKTASANLRVSEEKLGQTSGLMTITYEDDYGQTFTKTAEISTTIQPKPEPQEEEKPKEPKKAKWWWLFILIGAAVGCGAGWGIPLLIQDIRQRKEDDLRL